MIIVVYMKVLFIEPFYGGSHRNFVDGWIERSQHTIKLISLPARFWKWRQTGSAMFFADEIPPAAEGEWDAIVSGGMMDLAHLKALRPDLPPAMLYVHENQLAYPVSSSEEKDFRYGITDMVSMLSADELVFNSQWNRQSFINEANILFNRLPDAVPFNRLEQIETNSSIIYPGADTIAIQLKASVCRSSNIETGKPLVIWNHRHEHDKNPDIAFRTLCELAEEGIDFNLALLGERYKESPPAFSMVRKKIPNKIVCDYYPDRNEYIEWLCKGDIVISTADHEFFGISVIEAIAAGCFPYLPDRLSYPELLPAEFHNDCLWKSPEQFKNGLKYLLQARKNNENIINRLQESMHSFDRKNTVEELDHTLGAMISRLNRI